MNAKSKKYIEQHYHITDYLNADLTPNQIPILAIEQYIPQKLIGFDCLSKTKDYSEGVHFFLNDEKIDCVWKDPLKYIEKLKNFPCVLSPDFSARLDMTRYTIAHNVSRSRLIGQIWQKNGLRVIPTAIWAGRNTYDICFDGLPTGSVIAVSNVGVLRKKDSLRYFEEGLKFLIQNFRPSKILMYGTKVSLSFPVENEIFFENTNTSWNNSLKNKEKVHG